MINSCLTIQENGGKDKDAGGVREGRFTESSLGFS